MEIGIARDSNMSMGGNSLLRSLQNNATPRLDLFVRESVQNSLDAGKGGAVEVRFETGEADPASFACYFEGIERKLLQRASDRKGFLAVRDYGTEGLSGPVRLQDIGDGDHGNLRKLVYEIGKAQTLAGAGGSWGLGKTTAYRMGIGLVIYYSRFRNSAGGYESRLAATMVEDETTGNGILPPPADGSPSRGIAWWGDRDKLYPSDESTIPVTDEKRINEILSHFEITPYSGSETGTTIIIPFISEKELLRETRPAEGEPGKAAPWCVSLPDYLRIAVQRWYAPRLENTECFGDRVLRATVNGKYIHTSDMEPFFSLVQTLYTAGRMHGKSYRFGDTEIQTTDINLKATFSDGQCAGTIAFAEVSADDLQMRYPENNPDPVAYIGWGVSDTDRQIPVISYARSQGMVVSYETTGDWAPRLNASPPGRFVVGMFVPRSEAVIRKNGEILEEYLRESENADHMNWQDVPIRGQKQTIVQRIRKGVRRHVEYALSERPQLADDRKRDYGLGRALAEVLMPPTGFGAWDQRRGGSLNGPGGTGGAGLTPPGDKRPGTRASKRISVRITGPATWSGSTIRVPVTISMGTHTHADLRVRVETEGAAVEALEWERDMGTECPVSIKQFHIDKVYCQSPGKRRKRKGSKDAAQSVPHVQCRNLRTKMFGTLCGVDIRVDNATGDTYIEGTLEYTADRVDGQIFVRDGDTNERQA